MTIVGFTGSRVLAQKKESIVSNRLQECVRLGMTQAITGACKGIDSFIALYLVSEFPEISQTIVVPSNRKFVSMDIMKLFDSKVNYIYMPNDSNYRDRNIKIVELSEVMDAFWTGKKTYSGTYMTINIAKKADKLRKIIGI